MVLNSEQQWTYLESGITARDYFAAAVISGMYANHKMLPNVGDGNELAKVAYRQADAMLAARKEATDV